MYHPLSRTELKRLTVLAMTAAIATAVIYSLAPIPQDSSYHQFADSKTILDIPNFWNVTSNLPFIVVGLIGLMRVLQRHKEQASAGNSETASWSCFFTGVIFTGFGSIWYHLAPDNHNLVFNRLPMTIGLMALFAGVIAERVSHQAYRLLLWPLVGLGLASVISWYASELRDAGDLRLYILVHLFPLLTIPLMMAIYSPKYTHGIYTIFAIATYAVAKTCEHFDHDIFMMTGWLSGHVLSHLFAALACWFLVIMVSLRSRIVPNHSRE